eukprot:9492580-Ditylum_brightwellii.AAC.1
MLMRVHAPSLLMLSTMALMRSSTFQSEVEYFPHTNNLKLVCFNSGFFILVDDFVFVAVEACFDFNFDVDDNEEDDDFFFFVLVALAALP